MKNMWLSTALTVGGNNDNLLFSTCWSSQIILLSCMKIGKVVSHLNNVHTQVLPLIVHHQSDSPKIVVTAPSSTSAVESKETSRRLSRRHSKRPADSERTSPNTSRRSSTDSPPRKRSGFPRKDRGRGDRRGSRRSSNGPRRRYVNENTLYTGIRV